MLDLDFNKRMREREAEILRIIKIHEKAKANDQNIMEALNKFDTSSCLSSPSAKKMII